MKQLLLSVLLMAAICQLSAQSVGIGTTTPSASAQLDVSSSNKGFLMPRMTTEQRDAIASPAVGLQVFNLDNNCIDTWDGIAWLNTCGVRMTNNMLDGSWTKKADFGGGGRRGAVGFSIGSKGYIGTGFYTNSNLQDFWEYDPVSNVWSQKANVGGGGRQNAVGFSIGSKGYIGTGYNGTNDLQDFWEYDPASNAWTKKTDVGGGGRSASVGFSIGSKGYIGTGYNNGSYLQDFWEYDPTSNAWTIKAEAGGGARYTAVGFSIGSKGYIGTGHNGNLLKDFWEYDPTSNTWTKKADVGGGVRYLARGFSIGNKGYIGTGFTGSNYLQDFWEYDLATNSWAKKADFPDARYVAVGFSIGSRGYIGTGASNNSVANQDFYEYNPFSISQPWTKNEDNLFNTGLNTLVGIGTSSPQAKLDVAGTLKTTGLQLSTGAANGSVLRSDANGVASWVAPASLGISPSGAAGGDLAGTYPNPSLTATGVSPGTYSKLTIDAKGRATGAAQLAAGDITPLETDPQVGTNTTNYLSKWNGTQLVTSGMFESGGNVGIGTASPQAKLDVNGSIKTTGLQLTTGATNGYYLRSDANGIASWSAVTEADPQVGTNTTNYLSKWNGTALVSAAVFENGGNVGLGTASPSNRLSVSGNMDVTGSMGVATSTPAAKMDVNGNFKLGASGTVINNIIKFYADFGSVGVPANNTFVVTVSPIAGAVVGSTVFASPSVPLPPGMSIGFCRVVSNTVVELFFVNGSNAAQNTPPMRVFFTVIN